LPQAKGAQSSVTATQVQNAGATKTDAKAPAASSEPYAKTDAPSTAQTGAGKNNPDSKPKPADPDVVPGKGGQNQ